MSEMRREDGSSASKVGRGGVLRLFQISEMPWHATGITVSRMRYIKNGFLPKCDYEVRPKQRLILV